MVGFAVVVVVVGLAIITIDLDALSPDRARRQVAGPLDLEGVGAIVVVHVHSEVDGNSVYFPGTLNRRVCAVNDQTRDPG